jgi:hypothetical protein
MKQLLFGRPDYLDSIGIFGGGSPLQKTQNVFATSPAITGRRGNLNDYKSRLLQYRIGILLLSVGLPGASKETPLRIIMVRSPDAGNSHSKKDK